MQLRARPVKGEGEYGIGRFHRTRLEARQASYSRSFDSLTKVLSVVQARLPTRTASLGVSGYAELFSRPRPWLNPAQNAGSREEGAYADDVSSVMISKSVP